MLLENYWKKCLFHLHWHRKGRNVFLAIQYVFQAHLLYYLASKWRATAFSLLWQTWTSIFYSEICSVLVESEAFLPFFLSLNIYNIQSTIYIFKIYRQIYWHISLNTSIWVNEKVQRDLAGQVRLHWTQKVLVILWTGRINMGR